MPEWQAITGALWLGVLTSISPCPLATNIAAIAFLSRRAGQGTRIAWAGALYAAGRALAYAAVAAALLHGLLSAPVLSEFLRTKLGGLIGPLLILTGLVVAGWLPLKLPNSPKLNEWGHRLAGRGLLGEFLLGVLFALSFCPASAALFFLTLMPLAIQADSPVLVPLLYGFGTAVPVLAAVFIILRSADYAGRLRSLQRLGANLQTVTGFILLGVGAWLTLRNLLP